MSEPYIVIYSILFAYTTKNTHLHLKINVIIFYKIFKIPMSSNCVFKRKLLSLNQIYVVSDDY